MATIDNAEQVYNNSSKTIEDLNALKDIFETYFDVKNLIDYIIFGDIVNNWDGFRGKNWQWFTYDAVKWYCGVYDADMTFGYSAGNTISGPRNKHVCIESTASQHTLLMNRYILTYYSSELNAQYKTLRDSKIIDADSIISILQDSIGVIPKEIYKKEWSKWSNNFPKDCIARVYNWVKEEIRLMDILYDYN
jgi:hypothetical protein